MFDEPRFSMSEEVGKSAYPRRALQPVDPPVPVRIEVAQILRDDKPRWAERPLWLRVAGLDRHPTTGSLHGWVRSEDNDWFGIVSMELRSRRGQLHLVLPYQLVPASALSPLP